MRAAFYLADFFLQWESRGSWGSAEHYIPRSPYRKALMEDGLALKAAQGGRSRARRGEYGGAGGLGRLPDRARPEGRDAAAPGPRSQLREGLKRARGPGTLWRSPGPGKRRRRPSWAGGARGCQPPPRRYRPRIGGGLPPYRRFAAGNSRQVRFVEGRGRESRVWGKGAAAEQPLAPLCDAPVSGCGRQGQCLRRDTGCRHPGLRQHRAGRHSSVPLFGTEGKEREGKPGSSLALGRVSFSAPRFALPSRGDPAVRARVRAGTAAGKAARAPCLATRALPRVEKPRPRAPRPLPAAFPLRFFNDFLPEKN